VIPFSADAIVCWEMPAHRFLFEVVEPKIFPLALRGTRDAGREMSISPAVCHAKNPNNVKNMISAPSSIQHFAPAFRYWPAG
jgi:hypothetical protein